MRAKLCLGSVFGEGERQTRLVAPSRVPRRFWLCVQVPGLPGRVRFLFAQSTGEAVTVGLIMLILSGQTGERRLAIATPARRALGESSPATAARRDQILLIDAHPPSTASPRMPVASVRRARASFRLALPFLSFFFAQTERHLSQPLLLFQAPLYPSLSIPLQVCSLESPDVA